MRPPPWLDSGTLGRDLVLAGASLAGGLVLYALGWQPQVRPHAQVPSALFLPPLVAVCVAVGLRRVAPRASLAVGTAALVVDAVLGSSLGTVLVYTQVLYDACVYGPPRLWRWLLRITVALSLLGVTAGVVGYGHWRGAAFGVLVVLAGVLPVLTGISVRQYRDQAAAERREPSRLPGWSSWTVGRRSAPNGPGWPGSCTTWSRTTSARWPSTPPPCSPYPGWIAVRWSRRCG